MPSNDDRIIWVIDKTRLYDGNDSISANYLKRKFLILINYSVVMTDIHEINCIKFIKSTAFKKIQFLLKKSITFLFGINQIFVVKT